jgi:hypothetical protein
VRHAPDAEDVERMIMRARFDIADRIDSVSLELRRLNSVAAAGRQFKPGPFDFTIDKERTAVVRVLDVLSAALKKEPGQ